MVVRKKFFFSDQDIDRNDPVQINVMYNQLKPQVLDGTHPCTMEEAVEFAAMQLHIEYGSHSPDVHKPGFIDDLRAVLPAEYAKVSDTGRKKR